MSEKTETTGSEALAGCAVAVAVLVLAWFVDVALFIWRGFVLTKVWAWFVVAGFGVAPISTVTATGVALGVSLLNGHTAAKQEDGWKDSVGLVLGKFFAPLAILGLAYALKCWM